jgi:polysaccharide export outer membrane protein
MKPEPTLDRPETQWYALWVRSRQEKAAAVRLDSIGIPSYLPMLSEVHQWSDRRKAIDLPLFPGYLFACLDIRDSAKLKVLKTPGVVGFVGNASGPSSIPADQIESVRTAVACGADCSSRALMQEGDRVRVVRGALAGLEGVLVRIGAKSQLVISIEMIQRSVAVTVCEQDVEPIETQLPSARPRLSEGASSPRSFVKGPEMKTSRRIFSAVVLLGLSSVAALLQGEQIGNTAGAPVATATTVPQAGQPQLQQRYPRYVIQRSDRLLLSFPLSPEFDQSVTVQPDGYVNLKSSESIHVQGLTVPEMIDELKRAYRGVLREPIINIDLVDFQRPFFTVSGQVGKPGKYELRDEITVAEGLAVAGGMLPSAKTQVFLFHRTSQDWFEVKKVNLRDILTGKNANEDPVLKQGDMIYVPEKFIVNFRKYVPYTLNAGTYLDAASF